MPEHSEGDEWTSTKRSVAYIRNCEQSGAIRYDSNVTKVASEERHVSYSHVDRVDEGENRETTSESSAPRRPHQDKRHRLTPRRQLRWAGIACVESRNTSTIGPDAGREQVAECLGLRRSGAPGRRALRRRSGNGWYRPRVCRLAGILFGAMTEVGRGMTLRGRTRLGERRVDV